MKREDYHHLAQKNDLAQTAELLCSIAGIGNQQTTTLSAVCLHLNQLQCKQINKISTNLANKHCFCELGDLVGQPGSRTYNIEKDFFL